MTVLDKTGMDRRMDITDDSGLRGWSLCARGGSVILVVLMAIVIGMLIYYMSISTIFAPSLNRGRVAVWRPWLEEERILGPDKIIAMPEPPKPTIKAPINLVAAVTRNDADRGAMTLSFDVDGTVKGKWRCSYSHGEQDYAYDSAFAGNIDVDVAYASEDGQYDKSLLYFITKGRYTQQSTNAATQEQTRQDGEIYITGYLAPDHSASGLITITTDRKWSVTYDWKTK